MNRAIVLPILGLAGLLAMASSAQGQTRPYIGFVYPAGAQQGTTTLIRLGGQGMDGASEVIVSGTGVSAKVAECFTRLGTQETALMNEQLRELKKGLSPAAAAKLPGARPTTTKPSDAKVPEAKLTKDDETAMKYIARIEKRFAEHTNTPACASISSLVFVEVTVAPNAPPGQREIRLATLRGVSNPLVFYVGQAPEASRKPMVSATIQVLGKEESALRKRPEEEVEDRITVPCTMNGQIASGEVNRYRFEAKKGQRLVISTAARQLIPYIADAVPGWFQPVLSLYDAEGNEVAYNDDFRFKPDPLITFEVPKDGEYVLCITDAIYRGREDFVYRLTIGELPFVSSIYPLGRQAGATAKVDMKGWNLQGAQLTPPPKDAAPGVHLITANKKGIVSNAVPFALDTLPEAFDKEDNNDPAHAQEVKMPMIVNGRMDRRDDWDVFKVTGKAGETIVAEVSARRLDSPLDSVLKITDADGKLLAFNDDFEDAGSGVNTHHADSYLTFALPADGTYYVHLGDASRNGGEEYAYRLRLSAPQPDFALRVVPSSAATRSKSTASLSVYVIRKDGFAGPIKLSLKDPPEGFSSSPVTLAANQEMTRITVKTDLTETKHPVNLVVQGVATTDQGEIARVAVPSEDRMQAFLWRHLVPAEDLKVVVYDMAYQAPDKRAAPPPYVAPPVPAGAEKPKQQFTKNQVAGRLRQLKFLYEEYLLTEDFYAKKVAECEAAQ